MSEDIAAMLAAEAEASEAGRHLPADYHRNRPAPHPDDIDAAASAVAVYAERYREALGLDDLSSQPYVALVTAMQQLYPAETLRALAVLQSELGGAP